MKTISACAFLIILASTFACGSNKNSIGENSVVVQAKEDSSYVEGQSVTIRESSTKTEPSSITKPDTTATTKPRKRN